MIKLPDGAYAWFASAAAAIILAGAFPRRRSPHSTRYPPSCSCS